MALKITLLITKEVVFDKENGVKCYTFSTYGEKLKQLDGFLYLQKMGNKMGGKLRHVHKNITLT